MSKSGRRCRRVRSTEGFEDERYSSASLNLRRRGTTRARRRIWADHDAGGPSHEEPNATIIEGCRAAARRRPEISASAQDETGVTGVGGFLALLEVQRQPAGVDQH